MWQRGVLIVVCGLAVLGCAQRQTASPEEGLVVAPDIEARRAQFVVQELSADVSHLSQGDREALRHLVQAAGAIDEIFRVQAWSGNSGLASEVDSYTGANAQAVTDYYRIMYGPWDRLLHFEPFLGSDDGGIRGLARSPPGRA